tara:strand:- start:484 stop:1797 length:1314 start_codon:yes stop_codon:yes gene_type:complete
MPYYKFDKNDVFVNTLKLYPDANFVVYHGSSYYNSTPHISGAFTSSVRLTTPGDVSLYELNVDRRQQTTGRSIGQVEDISIIYPWVVKDGSRMNFRTNTSTAFAAELPGTVVTGALYPYTSAISKTYYSADALRVEMAQINTCPDDADCISGESGIVVRSNGVVSHLRALKNTINYYRYLSPQFEYASSADSIDAGISNRDFDSSSVGLVSIPSIFYGNNIKKGTVNLEIYYTGSLIARAEDTLRNGELIQTYGGTTEAARIVGSVVGLVLYNEGFIILTSSAALSNSTDKYLDVAGMDLQPLWTYFAQSISGNVTAPNTSFIMNMSGTVDTQVLTMFATAPKGVLNHSNNPSYLQKGMAHKISTGSQGYFESDTQQVKNVVSSSYIDPTGSFEKTTYISKVAIYDKNRNLLGVAKTATPIKKTVNRDFTFKIKLDI